MLRHVKTVAAGCLATILGIAGLMLAPAGASAATTASTAAGPRLAVTSLGFADSTVDASSGTADVTLNWTITDADAKATDVAGTVGIRMAGSTPGSYTGLTHEVTYDLTNSLTEENIASASGTAQDASFSYQFAVPQYAGTSTAQWVVTRVTAEDDQGHKIAPSGAQLSSFHPVLTATEAVDSTAPDYGSLMFGNLDQRPYLYDHGVSASISYYFEVTDAQSGLWRGTIRLSGPDGQTVATPFSLTYSPQEESYYCGTNSGIFFTDELCDIAVTIPAGAAPGTWKVSSLTLTDNAGNVTTYRGLNALPVTVTANQAITASDFSISPNPVNDWSGLVTAKLSMQVSGVSGGVTAVYVDETAGAGAGACDQPSTVPTVNADGTISVPLNVFDKAARCTITGIAVVDGAGDVSIYGSEYGAPDPGLVITQAPDTTPPVVTSASLSSTSIPSSPDVQYLNLTVNVDDPVAPVTDCLIPVYDSSGDQVDLGYDGSCNNGSLSGPIDLKVALPASLAPGTYTVAATLVDAGGLVASYGEPNDPHATPMPGGPLQFTLTGN
jgi:hypothetical protein